MKITPIAQGTGTPSGLDSAPGQSATIERINRAKMIAQGQDPGQAQPKTQTAQQEVKNKIQSIKMRTQRSPEVFNPEALQQVQPEVTPDQPADINIHDNNAETNSANAESKPISPQLAALAKAKRALQVKEREILAREKALSEQNGPNAQQIIEKLKANPLGALHEYGFTNEQLTEAILNSSNDNSPAVQALKSEIQQIKDELNGHKTALEQREENQKQQVLKQMKFDAKRLVENNAEFELVRETNSVDDVVRLIEENFNQTGEVLDLEEACKLIEDELTEESLKIASLNKIKGKLYPQQTEQPVNNDARPQMRTLTARDGATAPTSRKERAMAAFYGIKR